jgi:phosphoribosylglycinamide formyltransferase-1
VLKRNRINSLEKLIFNNDELNSDKILNDLQNLSPDLIVLAGFLKKIPEKIVDLFRNKIVNIHPSLLPKYGGKGMFGINVHKSVIENNEEYSGFTIHYVNKNYDEGDIIFQKKIIINTENPLDLAKKILVEEHKYYPQIIENILNES